MNALLIVLLLVVLGMALLYRAEWLIELADRKAWERRARAAGWHPEMTSATGDHMWSKIEPHLKPYPRPMGARGWTDAASLSTEQDAQRLREWREHRAVHALDHHRKHFVAGSTDSECATELMQFLVGPMECEGE